MAALPAVLLTAPEMVLPFYSGVFMEWILLGAIFGLMELSGFAHSLV